MGYSNETQNKRNAAYISAQGFGRMDSKPGPAIFNVKRHMCPHPECSKAITVKQLTQYGICPTCIKLGRVRPQPTTVKP